MRGFDGGPGLGTVLVRPEAGGIDRTGRCGCR